MDNILLTLLVVSLPFEKLLTFNAFGFTMKLPYLFGILFILNSFTKFAKSRLFKKLSLDKIDILLLAFSFWCLLSTFWSIDKKISFIIGLMLVFMSAIFIFVRRSVSSENQEKYLKIFVWLGTLTALLSFWQFYGDMVGFSQKITFLGDAYVKGVFPFPRVQSTFFEPGYFAHFLQIPLFLSIYFSQKDKKYLGHLFIIVLAFFLTLSRGGLIALIITAVILLVILSLKKISWKTILPSIYVSISSFVIGVFIVYISSGLSGVKIYFRQLQNSSDFIQVTRSSQVEFTRSYTIKVALDNWKKHPVFGIGTGAFGSLPEFSTLQAKGNSRQTVNSIYPEIMVEEGVIGLAIFLLLLMFISLSLLKENGSKDYLNVLMFSAIISMFIQYAALTTLYLVYVWVFMGIALKKNSKN